MAAVLKHLLATERAGASRPYHLDRRWADREEALARVSLESRVVFVDAEPDEQGHHRLSPTTTDAQLRALFSRCGALEKVAVVIDGEAKTPTGSAYVVFFAREAALQACSALRGAVVDGRRIRVQLDKGLPWHVPIELGYSDERKVLAKARPAREGDQGGAGGWQGQRRFSGGGGGGGAGAPWRGGGGRGRGGGRGGWRGGWRGGRGGGTVGGSGGGMPAADSGAAAAADAPLERSFAEERGAGADDDGDRFAGRKRGRGDDDGDDDYDRR